MNHGRRSRRGFTLIELLVVISIIALLVAILLPALRAARETARSVACLSNQRQIGIATMGYRNDYEDFLPMVHVNDPSLNWVATLTTYLSESSDLTPGSLVVREDVYLCPSGSDDLEAAIADFGTQISEQRPTTYAMSRWTSRQEGDLFFPGWRPYESLRGSVLIESDFLLLADSYPQNWRFFIGRWDDMNMVGFRHGGRPRDPSVPANDPVASGVVGIANGLFVDGHAESMDAESASSRNTTRGNRAALDISGVASPYATR